MNKDKVQTEDFRWECSSCHSLLGFLDKDKSEVRIKRQDLYIRIKGGIVTIICYRCGKENTISDEHYVKYLEKGGN